MKKNSVFQYKDFFEFLTFEIKKNAHANRGEKKRIAIELNIPPSLLSQIFSGTRKLTDDQVYLLSEYFGYSSLEKEYVDTLFKLSNVSNRKLKAELSAKCETIRSKSKKISNRVSKDRSLSESEKSILYSSWQYIAVWAYTSLEDGKTFDEIVERFGFTRKAAQKILDFLLSSGLCILKSNRYVHGANSTHIEKYSPHYTQHHNNWRIKSIQKLDSRNDDDLSFTAPLSLSKKDFEKFRETVILLIENLYTVVKDTNPEEVYCLNIDFFSI